MYINRKPYLLMKTLDWLNVKLKITVVQNFKHIEYPQSRMGGSGKIPFRNQKQKAKNKMYRKSERNDMEMNLNSGKK